MNVLFVLVLAGSHEKVMKYFRGEDQDVFMVNLIQYFLRVSDII